MCVSENKVVREQKSLGAPNGAPIFLRRYPRQPIECLTFSVARMGRNLGDSAFLKLSPRRGYRNPLENFRMIYLLVAGLLPVTPGARRRRCWRSAHKTFRDGCCADIESGTCSLLHPFLIISSFRKFSHLLGRYVFIILSLFAFVNNFL